MLGLLSLIPLAVGRLAPEFPIKSAYANLTATLQECDSKNGSQLSTSARLACGLQCQAHEQILEESFEPWWDNRIPAESFQDACRKVGARFSLAFIGAISKGRVFYKCCSTGGPDSCAGTPMDAGGDKQITDLELLVTLIAEIAQEAKLPDMHFLFNIGDQPFTDKMYWSPVPQFHWVRCHGHWTIPLPNPFQLRAHVKDLLGDSTEHQQFHVPWADKIPKVFWRGSVSAPDNVVARSTDTLPRVRLLKMGARNPDLFDVEYTGLDDEMYTILGKAAVDELLSKLQSGDHVHMQKALPKFKYVICVSAVLSSWRLNELLASGSVLLLQEDTSREVIYEWLTPWEHFVPISTGLSDLIEKVHWLEANQEEAEAIARRGFLWFQKRVRRQDTYCYMWQLLEALARATEEGKVKSPEELKKDKKWKEVSLATSHMKKKMPYHTPLGNLLDVNKKDEL